MVGVFILFYLFLGGWSIVVGVKRYDRSTLLGNRQRHVEPIWSGMTCLRGSRSTCTWRRRSLFWSFVLCFVNLFPTWPLSSSYNFHHPKPLNLQIYFTLLTLALWAPPPPPWSQVPQFAASTTYCSFLLPPPIQTFFIQVDLEFGPHVNWPLTLTYFTLHWFDAKKKNTWRVAELMRSYNGLSIGPWIQQQLKRQKNCRRSTKDYNNHSIWSMSHPTTNGLQNKITE